jgi:hypothetical protein
LVTNPPTPPASKTSPIATPLVAGAAAGVVILLLLLALLYRSYHRNTGSRRRHVPAPRYIPAHVAETEDASGIMFANPAFALGSSSSDQTVAPRAGSVYHGQAGSAVFPALILSDESDAALTLRASAALSNAYLQPTPLPPHYTEASKVGSSTDDPEYDQPNGPGSQVEAPYDQPNRPESSEYADVRGDQLADLQARLPVGKGKHPGYEYAGSRPASSDVTMADLDGYVPPVDALSSNPKTSPPKTHTQAVRQAALKTTETAETGNGYVLPVDHVATTAPTPPPRAPQTALRKTGSSPRSTSTAKRLDERMFVQPPQSMDEITVEY